MADLRTQLCGLALPHPVLAAAGPATASGEALLDVARGGAAGMVTITISPRAAAASAPAPLAPFRADRGSLLNAGQWATLPLEAWVDDELPYALVAAGKYGIPLIASVGYSPDELRAVAPAVRETGVDAFELSCMHLEPEQTVASAIALREVADGRPIIAKLSANTPDLAALARDLEPHVDAFACINSVGPGLRIDIETGRAALPTPNGFGWLTGTAVQPMALRAVYEVARATKRPIIGVGGISSGRDVASFLLVGATAVQVCTAAVLEGPDVFARIRDELSAWLDAQGYPSVEAARGAYLRRWGSGQREVIEKEESPVVNRTTCIGCTLCERVCFYDAIAAPPKVIATVFDEPCFQCGLCVSVCPVNALDFRPRADVTLPTA